jgi:UDP-N-acetylmuramoyl-tripeptide--D-alanyl-D-alanine ligase
MQARRTRAGAVLLDDSYNANPTSMAAALETLAALDAEHRVAVLGVMAEIDDSTDGHARIARLAVDLGVELIAVDTDLYGVASSTLDQAIARVSDLGDECAVLVKASRSARLDRVVDAIV